MTLLQRIEGEYTKMTPANQKIAKYLYEHYNDVVFCTLSELAARAGVSTATLVRFAAAMGFSGYTQMQKHIRITQEVKQNNQTDVLWRPDFDRAVTRDVCGRLKAAADILVIGYTDAFGTAAEFLHRLFVLRQNVHFIRLISDWNEILLLMRPGTTAFVVSYSPHYDYTLEYVKTAKDRGCEIITLTDGPLNPLAAISDLDINIKLCRNKASNMCELSQAAAYVDHLFEVWHEVADS